MGWWRRLRSRQCPGSPDTLDLVRKSNGPPFGVTGHASAHDGGVLALASIGATVATPVMWLGATLLPSRVGAVTGALSLLTLAVSLPLAAAAATIAPRRLLPWAAIGLWVALPALVVALVLTDVAAVGR